MCAFPPALRPPGCKSAPSSRLSVYRYYCTYEDPATFVTAFTPGSNTAIICCTPSRCVYCTAPIRTFFHIRNVLINDEYLKCPPAMPTAAFHRHFIPSIRLYVLFQLSLGHATLYQVSMLRNPCPVPQNQAFIQARAELELPLQVCGVHSCVFTHAVPVIEPPLCQRGMRCVARHRTFSLPYLWRGLCFGSQTIL